MTAPVGSSNGVARRRLTVVELQSVLRAAQTPAPVGTVSPVQRCPVMTEPADSAPPSPAPKASAYVVAAHAGAGASTVAVGMADVLARTGPVYVVEWRAGRWSGLGSAVEAELGVLPSGAWRRGRRGVVVIDRSVRPTSATAPAPTDVPGARLVDAGTATEDDLPADAVVVLVCRATVPGIRAAEAWMAAREPESLVIVAAVGPSRWPGAVSATAGPRVRALRDAGRVVAIPVHRRLERTGLTVAALPRPVLAAARRVVGLLPLTVGEAS